MRHRSEHLRRRGGRRRPSLDWLGLVTHGRHGRHLRHRSEHLRRRGGRRRPSLDGLGLVAHGRHGRHLRHRSEHLRRRGGRRRGGLARARGRRGTRVRPGGGARRSPHGSDRGHRAAKYLRDLGSRLCRRCGGEDVATAGALHRYAPGRKQPGVERVLYGALGAGNLHGQCLPHASGPWLLP